MVERPAVPGVRVPAAGLHRRRGPAVPALRRRRDRQPGRRARHWPPAFVAAGYVARGRPGRAAGSRTGGFWPSLLATVRGRAGLPAAADAGSCGSPTGSPTGARAAPYDALADFSRRIGHSPAPGSAAADDREAAAAGVSTPSVPWSARRRAAGRLPTGSGRRRRLAARGRHRRLVVVIPIQDRPAALGSIGLDLPPGRDVRPPERRLLADIAEQAAVAFRNARLQVELAARVDHARPAHGQLAASRYGSSGPATPSGARLEACDRPRGHRRRCCRRWQPTSAAAPQGADAPPPTRLVDQATAALDALRELTRGIFPTMLHPGRPRSGPVRRTSRGSAGPVSLASTPRWPGRRLPGTGRGRRVLLLHRGRAGGDAHRVPGSWSARTCRSRSLRGIDLDAMDRRGRGGPGRGLGGILERGR